MEINFVFLSRYKKRLTSPQYAYSSTGLQTGLNGLKWCVLCRGYFITLLYVVVPYSVDVPRKLALLHRLGEWI